MQTSANLPLALTAEQIKSPAARAALVQELVGNPFDRGEAEAFVAALRRSAAGEEIRPDEQAFFDAQKAMIESRERLEELRTASIERTTQLEMAKDRVKIAGEQLTKERDLAKVVAACLEDDARLAYWKNRRGILGPIWGVDAAINAGSYYAGAREILAALSDVVIPAAEKELSQATAALAELIAANENGA